MMFKFVSASAIAIALLCASMAEAKSFDCARAKSTRGCARFAIKGCFWCDDQCGHYTECKTGQRPVCEKLKANNRRQKLICKAQGCNVVGRKCVSADVDVTKPPTKAPAGCKHPIKVIKGKVDKSGYCTSKCPCDEYEGDCDAYNQCMGDL